MKYVCLFILAAITGTIAAQTNYTYFDTLTLGCGNVRLVAPQVILDNEGINPNIYNITTVPYFNDTLINFIQVDLSNPSFNAVPVGFNFYFFGSKKNYIYIENQGFIGFANNPGANPPIQPIPSNLYPGGPPRNCIMAPWMLLNIDPWGGNNGTIRYGVKGVAPNRRFIVEYRNIPTLCQTEKYSGSIILNESTNTIETQILNKPLCTQWGTDNAVHGLHNANGLFAAFVPGRNATEWSTDHEGTRFTPYDTLYVLNSVNWYNDQNQPVTTNDTLLQPIGLSTNYTYTAKYINVYGGDTITVTKHYLINVDTGNLQLVANNLPFVNNTFNICGNGIISATGMYNYNWKNNQETNFSNDDSLNVGALPNGTYYLIGNKNNCSDTISFTVINQAIIDTVTILTCPNQYLDITADYPGSSWINFSGDFSPNNPPLTIYTPLAGDTSHLVLSIPDGNCTNYKIYSIQTDPIQLLSAYYSIFDINLYTNAPTGTYLNWYCNGVLVPNQHGTFITPTAPGNYYAEYISPYGCGTVTSQIIYSTNTIEDKYAFDVYPNPAANFVTVNLENFTGKIYNARFFNMMGQQVYSTNTLTTQVPISQLPNGTYLFQLNTSEGILSKIIVIEK